MLSVLSGPSRPPSAGQSIDPESVAWWVAVLRNRSMSWMSHRQTEYELGPREGADHSSPEPQPVQSPPALEEHDLTPSSSVHSDSDLSSKTSGAAQQK